MTATPPASIMQGDTLTWRLVSSDASPADATLSVRVSSPSGTIDVLGVADGTAWIVTVTDEQTQRLGAGLLRYMARATYGSGQVLTIAAGTLTSVAVSALGTGSGTASHAARMVALLEAQRERLAADSLDAYTIGDRQATRRKLAEVESSLRAARRELSREQNGGRLPPVRMVFPTFAGVIR
jgi:hypothetical protein